MKKGLGPLGLLIAAVFILLITDSCRKSDIIYSNNDALLSFSQDTVLFDTVFTTIGSSTRYFKVYNTFDQSLNISSIRLAKGEASPFRINVDGVPAFEYEDLKIRPGDSAFIHVMVTINPTNANNPLLIQDSVLFETNDNQQDVDLVAYGQDAYFHSNEVLQGQHLWTNEKPHVVYGFVLVDDTLSSSLTIEAGTKVHMHDNSSILVAADASLMIEGTVDDPVEIQGDRLEGFYDDVPGQWGVIFLSAGSINNRIEGAIIKNGTAGILVDTVGNSSEPTLLLHNTKIYNMSYYGIRAQGSYVRASNSVFANCGEFEVVLQYGGDYEFYHCTLGDYTGSGSQPGALVLNNYYTTLDGDTIGRDLTKASFYNSIIYGSQPEEELLMSVSSMAEFNYYFENCDIKTERVFEDFEQFVNCFDEDPLFHNTEKYDFRIDTITSPLINSGNISLVNGYPYYNLSDDLLNFGRFNDEAPDLGAYEYQEIPEEEEE